MPLITFALAIVTLGGPASAQSSREQDLDASYPCATHLTLADKENLGDYHNATKNDPCIVTESREELDKLARSLAVSAADIERRMQAYAAEEEARKSASSQQDNASLLDAFANQGAAVAQFQCEYTDYAMAGVADFSGKARVRPLAVVITQTGTALINGTAIQPRDTRPADLTAGQTPQAALYDIRDVMRALEVSLTAAPPVLGLTPDEMRQLGVFTEFSHGLQDKILEGRDRFMGVFLDQNTIGFFDRGANGQPVNASAATCIRTQ